MSISRADLKLIAQVLEGLQVPVSLGMPLGTAVAPWQELHAKHGGFGWTDAERLERSLEATDA